MADTEVPIKPKTGFGGRVVWSGVATALTAAISYVLQRIFGQLGWLDPMADAASKFLAVHVSPSLAGWVLALIVGGALYLLILWRVWRPRHIHHLPIQAETKPVASIEMEVTRSTGPPTTPRWGDYEKEWDWLRAKEEGRLQAVRDTSLPEALAYIATGRWGERFFDAVAQGEAEEVSDAPQRLRQLAHDGVIKVWGKRSQHGIHVQIPADYWVDHGIEWFELLRGRSKTEKKSIGGGEASDIYTELMVSRAEIETVWPWTATKTNDSARS